jgi:hypothetical protein
VGVVSAVAESVAHWKLLWCRRWESNPHELGSSRDFEFGLASGRNVPNRPVSSRFLVGSGAYGPIIGACGTIGTIPSNRAGTVWAQRLLPPRRKPEFWLTPHPLGSRYGS